MTTTNAEAQEHTEAQTKVERQTEILNEVEPRGFHLDQKRPCLCGAEFIETRKKLGYSDYLTFYHSCTECGHEFTTYIEG